MYKFAKSDCPSKYFFELVERIDNYRNELFDLNSNDFVKNENEKGIISRPVMKQYPIGGGIVWDSTPEGERMEALNKAKIIDNVLNKINEQYA